jgi:hypothetical protein
MNFRLMWQEAKAGAVDMDSFNDAREYTIEACVPDFRSNLVAGLDYAKKRDATILTIGRIDPTPVLDPRALVRPGDEQPIFYKKTIIAWYELAGRRWKDIQGGVVDALALYAVHTVVCDATGVGDPLAEQLQDLLPGVRVVPFVLSHVGNDMLFKLYLQEIEAGRLTYAAGEATQLTREYQAFRHEHEVLQKTRMGVYTKFEAPEGDHDDYCDSGALFCYAASLPREVEIESTVNPLFMNAGNIRNRAERYRRSRH